MTTAHETDAAGSRSAYTEAGVDVTAGEQAVDLLRRRIGRAGAAGTDLLGGLGGFGAALPVPAGYREPVLVSATDGVGTKTEIARRMGRRDTIGIDLVAMCADDVVCHGARPFFFLDYVAVGRLDPSAVAELVGGVADGCREAGCALVGGETAEHPGLMPDDAFDLAGFCVGIVERRDLLDGSGSRAGDAILGLASSGLHANGYSLVRAVLERHGLALDARVSDLLSLVDSGDSGDSVDSVDSGDPGDPGDSGVTLGDALLRPTSIYAPAVLGLRDHLAARALRLSGIAHVTGGGLSGNLPRAVPPDLGVVVDPARWPVPPIVTLVATLAGIGGAETRATFNAGIGMAVVVEPAAVQPALAWLRDSGRRAWEIGSVVDAASLPGTRYAERAW